MTIAQLLGIHETSFHYYKNQDLNNKRKTRSKIRQDYNVHLKRGRKLKDILPLLTGKWLCTEGVVRYAIREGLNSQTTTHL
ncbi:hypothetical protein SAMN04488084_106155 [Pedobacter antarcticus]|nr:hypothetical protein SAMN04488084_106155 [Pedobacter antarcticus]